MNVTHDIVLLLQNNADFETQYGNIFNEIEKAVDNLTNCSKGKIPGRHPLRKRPSEFRMSNQCLQIKSKIQYEH